jgi:hypothetical protein
METIKIKGLTYEELREVFSICEARGENFKTMVYGISDGYLSFEELIHNDYFTYEDKYYGSEEYCIDGNGDLQDKDNVVWVDDLEEYYPTDECVFVWTGRRCQEWFHESEINRFYRYNGDLYTDDALEAHDLVVMDGGDIEHSDDVYWWESDDNWHYEPDYDNEEYVRDYHNGGYRSLEFNDVETKYRIGFEIEKEDCGVKRSICIGEFEDNTGYLWRKERDGSLDEEDGYELVSPTFDFSIKHIFEHINSNEILVKHINAEYAKSCGGHINLSKKGHSGSEMFNEVKGYTPLLYALYYGRVNKNYSKGKSNRDLVNDDEKYQAIRIHSNRIEFRIISAVPSVEVLKWRCELIETMLKYPCDDVRDAYYYFDTKFSKVIKKVYDTEDKYKALKDRLRKFTLEFENIALKDKEELPSKRRKAQAKLLQKYKHFSAGAKIRVVKTTATDEEWGSCGQVTLHYNVGDIVEVKRFNDNRVFISRDCCWYPMQMFELHEKSTIKSISHLRVGDEVVAVSTTAPSEDWIGVGEVQTWFNVGDTLTIDCIGERSVVLRGNSWSYPHSMFIPNN